MTDPTRTAHVFLVGPTDARERPSDVTIQYTVLHDTERYMEFLTVDGKRILIAHAQIAVIRIESTP